MRALWGQWVEGISRLENYQLINLRPFIHQLASGPKTNKIPPKSGTSISRISQMGKLRQKGLSSLSEVVQSQQSGSYRL